MNPNTTMQLFTVPAARKIHPVGHTPPARPASCRPRALRSGLAPQQAPAEASDSFVLGVRIRNAAHFRRRRAVAAVIITAIVLALWSAGSVLAHHLVPAAASDPIPTAAAAVHVVQPGDTLWSIATEVVGAPEAEVRRVVDELASRSGGANLEVGQQIALDGLGRGLD